MKVTKASSSVFATCRATRSLNGTCLSQMKPKTPWLSLRNTVSHFTQNRCQKLIIIILHLLIFHPLLIYFITHMQKKYQNILAYSDYLPYLCTRNNNNGVGGIAQPVRAHDS